MSVSQILSAYIDTLLFKYTYLIYSRNSPCRRKFSDMTCVVYVDRRNTEMREGGEGVARYMIMVIVVMRLRWARSLRKDVPFISSRVVHKARLRQGHRCV
jgi:hypothetical protein